MITEVVQPLMIRFDQSSKIINENKEQIEELNKIVKIYDKDFLMLKRGYRKFDDFQKTISEIEINMKMVKVTTDGLERSIQMTIESNKI